MSKIYCNKCREIIVDSETVFEIITGYVEHGVFTPEMDKTFFCVDCLPVNEPTTDD